MGTKSMDETTLVAGGFLTGVVGVLALLARWVTGRHNDDLLAMRADIKRLIHYSDRQTIQLAELRIDTLENHQTTDQEIMDRIIVLKALIKDVQNHLER